MRITDTASVDEWRVEFLRSLRHLGTLGLIVETAAIVEFVYLGLWRSLPLFSVGYVWLWFGRLIVSRRGQALLETLRHG